MAGRWVDFNLEIDNRNFKLNKCLTILLLITLIGNVYSKEKQITFVCTGNTGRSVMAEYLSNYKYAFPTHEYLAISRGVSINKIELAPESNAVVVMDKEYIDISKHQAKQISQRDINNSFLVLTMTVSHRDQIQKQFLNTSNVHTLSECATGKDQDIIDAYGKNLKVYLQTRKQIQSYIENIVNNDFRCVR